MPFNVDSSADFQLYLPLGDGLDVRQILSLPARLNATYNTHV